MIENGWQISESSPISGAWLQPTLVQLVEQQAEGHLSMMRRESQPVCIVVPENLELVVLGSTTASYFCSHERDNWDV